MITTHGRSSRHFPFSLTDPGGRFSRCRTDRNPLVVFLSRADGVLWQASIRLTLLVLVSLLLVFQLACSPNSYEIVQIPMRDADLYPDSETKAGLVVAIDQISNSQRVLRYFGTNLDEKGILPIQVIVSNHGKQRVTIQPSDVLMLRGRAVVDPLPTEKVREIPKSEASWMEEETADQIDDYFAELAFKEMIVRPGETVHGVLFFEIGEKPGRKQREFQLISPFAQPSFRLQLVVTNMEDNQRIPFGPFGVYSY